MLIAHLSANEQEVWFEYRSRPRPNSTIGHRVYNKRDLQVDIDVTSAFHFLTKLKKSKRQ